MEIKVLGSAGGQAPGQNLTGFRIGADLLLDAGTSGMQLTLPEQRAIRHVLLTHTHLDHLNALPFLLDNLIGRVPEGLSIYGPASVLEALRRDIFNGTIWPDFTRLPVPEAPVARLQAIEPGRPFQAGEYRAEAVAVDHTVPAVAYLVSNARGTVLFTGDTGPTRAVWERTRQVADLKAVFIEASFPSSRQEIASRTGHLTPSDVRAELAKLGDDRRVPVYLYHLKPEFAAEIAAEAPGLAPWQVRVPQSGETLEI